MFKKILCMLLIIAVFSLAAAGCDTGNDETTPEGTTTTAAGETSDGTTEETTTMETPEDVVITFEHQDTEKPERAEFYDQLAARFNEIYPNVTIEITKSTFSDAQTLILTAISSGEPFDIIGQGPGTTKIWLEQNAIRDLTEYLEADGGEWKNTFRDGVYEALKYSDGKIYCIPTAIDAAPLNYNMSIFEELNVEPATTKDEFYELCDKFKEEGYIPFQLHGSMFNVLMNVISLQFATRDGYTPFDIVEGRAAFTEPWFTDMLAIVKEMYDNDYLPKDFWTIGGTDGRMAYSTGQMPQKFGFYWDVDTHKEMGMPYEIQGVHSMPDFTNGEVTKPYKVMGVFSFMVSSEAAYPDIAVEFLKFMTNEENQDDLAYKYFGRYPNGMPVVNKNVNLSDYALEYMNDIATGIGTPFSFMNVSLESVEVLGTTMPLFLQGEITLEEAAQEFDKLRNN